MVEDIWQPGKESALALYFRPPFLTSAKMQTALTKKFLQVSLQANYQNPTFQVRNPRVVDSLANNGNVTFRSINPSNQVMVSSRVNHKSK